MSEIQLLGIWGSLRAKSLNGALIQHAAKTAKAPVKVVPYDLSEVPLYNEDLDVDPVPNAVERLKVAIRASQGVLIATPEYNYSVSGVLKNAIDWVSRPAFRSPLANKPIGILSAATGASGGVRAQGHLKQIMLGTAALVFPYPEVSIGAATEKISDTGEITDDRTKQLVQYYVSAFAKFAAKQAGGA